MGAFDHLIPKQPTGGAFDHLIPGAPTAGGVQDYEPRQFTAGEKAARVVGAGAQGFTSRAADIVGAPVDAAAWLLRQAGVNADDPVGGSASIRRGIDYVASVPGKVGLTTKDAPVRFEPVTTAEKGAQGVGEGVADALSVLVPAAAVANTARAGTATQGVARTLATQPATQIAANAVGGGVTGATDNPLLGLGAALAVPAAMWAGRGAISPVINRNSPQEARLVAAAGREGVPLTAGQRTGSPGLRAIEDTMAKIPGSSGPMKGVVDQQRQQFNRAVLQRAGIDAQDASPETLARAFDNIGQTFDDLATRTTLNVDNEFVRDVQHVARAYGRRLETNVAGIFQSYMDDLAPLLQKTGQGANPQVAGDIYATIRSDIGRTIRTNGKNPDLQNALRGLQDAMDDVVERSVSGAVRNEWRQARRQYQALMTVDKAMQGGTQADRAAGNIPLSALKSAVAQGDRAGYSRGRGQLNEMSRVGDLIGQRTPNSGTPTRNAIANPLMWPVMGAANLGARAYNTPMMQNYLTNQVAGQTNLPGLYGGLAAQQLTPW